MTKRRDHRNFSHFVAFTHDPQHLPGRVERVCPEADEFRPADARSEEQADDEAAQAGAVELHGGLVRRGRPIASQDCQLVLPGPVVGGRKVFIHRLFLIEFRQALLHFGTLDIAGGIGFQDALLHQEPAESAEHRHVLMHRPRFQAPGHAVRLIPPQHRRGH